MGKKLFVDDERNPPDESWDVARTATQAMYMLQTYQYDELALDHDLGLGVDDRGNELNGYTIVKWLAEQKFTEDSTLHIPPVITCHSSNPAGKKNILSVVNRYLS